MSIEEPKAPRREKKLTLYGDTRIDPWFWLREKNDPETIPYLEAENAYTEAALKSTEGLQEDLYREMRARIKEDDSSVPEKEGDYHYYTRFETGGQYPIHCRKRGSLEGEEKVLLDVNALAVGQDFMRIGVCRNSPDHRWLAYSTDTDGSEEYTLRARNLETGEDLKEAIPGTYYSLAWANDSRTFFYTVLDDYHRPVKVYRHRLGGDPAQDALVYEEKDERFFVSVHRSASRQFIYIAAGGNNMSEWRFLDADDPGGELRLVEPRRKDFEYDVVDHGARFLVRHNGDGAKIPISLVHRKDTPLDGSAPLILGGYGSYGSCTEAAFSANRLSMADRGFILALAHIRGGMEMGWNWYENGKLLKKKNTFTDFIDCAEHLVRENYVRKGEIAAIGGSAGGLLMGAVINLRPDLFRAVVAHVPFVDVLNTMLDDTLPLTTMEYNEWGNPNHREFYDYIKSYSPYDNVAEQDYPHLLITAGINDPRVTYWEPAKWTAKLRQKRTNDNMLLLKTHMESGHAGASGRFDYLKEIALDWAFILKAFGKA